MVKLSCLNDFNAIFCESNQGDYRGTQCFSQFFPTLFSILLWQNNAELGAYPGWETPSREQNSIQFFKQN